MKKRIALVFIIVAVSFFSGCASYTIKYNGNGDGYDVYRPDPYLMITQGKNQAGKEVLAAEIVWLPNFKERYRIDTWNFLGKADFQFDITDGWKLTKITDKSDNTTIASKLLDIVQKATGIKTISPAEEEQVQLFRLVYDKETGEFTGLKKVPYELK